jgi:excisionase family DNA binding protein
MPDKSPVIPVPHYQPRCQLLTPQEAAAELGVSPGTLSIWRCAKRYPLKYIRVGSRIRYRLRDIEQFLESRVVNGGREAARRA